MRPSVIQFRAVRPSRAPRAFAVAALLPAALALSALSVPSAPLVAQQPARPPAPAPLKPASFPPFQEATLANGVRVVLVESHRDPIVAFRLVLPAGSMYDAKGKEGTAAMVAGLLTKGAGVRSAEQVAEAIESAGGTLAGFADRDFLSVAGQVLSENAPLAFQLLGDAVARPTFAEQEVELRRTQTLSELQLDESSPEAIARKAFAAGLYGSHPYGRTASSASTRAIARGDLTAFQQARLRPRGALLVVAGDVTMPQLRTMAEQAFAGWTGYPAAAPAPAAPPARTRTEILLVHRPGSVQSNILIGNLTGGPADPVRYPAAILNKLLGGGADARLFDILREKKGWTYGAYTSLSRPRGTGTFTASAETRTEVTDSALVELMAQLRRVGAEPVPAAELDNAKGALVGSFPLTIETAQQVAEEVAEVKTLGLPANYLQTYRTRLAAVTPADVQQAARRWVRPQGALVVVVGDGAKLYERIKGIAPVRIVTPQGDAMTPADLAPRTVALALDASKLRARRDSFNLLVQGNALGWVVNTLERKGDGWTATSAQSIANGMVRQSSTTETDAALAPRRYVMDGSLQGQPLKGEVTFANGKATGTAAQPGPAGVQQVKVDVAVPAGTIDDNTVTWAIEGLAWTAGAKHVVGTFVSGKNAVLPYTLAVTGTEKVTVPAGTFDTFKVEQTGGEQNPTYYVTQAAPHRVVKITIAGTPLAIELVK